MKTDVSQIIKLCQEKLAILQEMIPCQEHQIRLEEIDYLISNPDIWSNPLKAATIMKERQKISDLLDQLSYFKERIVFYAEYLEFFPKELESMSPQIEELHSKLVSLEFKQMLNEPTDDSPAILTINAGAGGLEAANWVTMLMRMYMRWANNHDFKIEILDMKESSEHSSICTDSVSIRIEGPYAFGFLKGEAGVHRLIRNSPFDADDARHTSCSAVAVMPDIEDTIEIKINENDLDITTMRGSGPGGQAVNKIESAVRIKHIPTGIIVNSRAESSQTSNKRFAFKMLKAKLYEYELKKKQDEKNKYVAELSDISFGHQIRTYYFNPYQLVKDHRTDFEDRNTENVMDGDIQPFILSYLQSREKIE